MDKLDKLAKKTISENENEILNFMNSNKSKLNSNFKVEEIICNNDKVNLVKKESNLIMNKHQLQPIINKEIIDYNNLSIDEIKKMIDKKERNIRKIRGVRFNFIRIILIQKERLKKWILN